MSENRHAQHTLPAQLRFCASLSFARRLSVSVDRCIDQSNNITILLQRKFLPRIESTPPSIININNNNNSARMNGQHQWRRRRHGLGGQAPRASSRRHGRRPYHGCRPRLPRASCMLPLLPSSFSFSPLALPIFHLTRCPVCCPPSLTHSSRTAASYLHPIFSTRSLPLPHSCNAYMRTRYTRTTDEVRVARWAGQSFLCKLDLSARSCFFLNQCIKLNISRSPNVMFCTE